MNDDLNGGFWSSLLSGDWQHMRNNLVMLAAATRPPWMAPRIFEAMLIALLTSALTTGAGYVLVVVRLDERMTAMQRDMDARTAARKAEDLRIDARVERGENRLIEHEAALARELAAIREAIGRLDGRTDNKVWRRP